MNITLTRYGSIPGKGTFGSIEGFYSIEREWLDNQSGVSCIPAGEYKLVPHTSKRYGQTWAVVGDGVSHWKDEGKRWGILFHAANWQKDVKGCIGLGLKFGDSWNVSSSKVAVNKFLALLSNESEHTLTIKWENNG